MPTRRTVLTAALAASVLGACTPPEQAPPPPAPSPDPDQARVAEAWAAEAGLLSLLDAVASGRPRRARALAGTRAVHVAHVGLLADAAPGLTPPSPSPASFSGVDREAYQAVARAEDQLGQTLRRTAFGAGSGPLARVLASMAAAAAQQSVTVRTLA